MVCVAMMQCVMQSVAYTRSVGAMQSAMQSVMRARLAGAVSVGAMKEFVIQSLLSVVCAQSVIQPSVAYLLSYLVATTQPGGAACMHSFSGGTVQLIGLSEMSFPGRYVVFGIGIDFPHVRFLMWLINCYILRVNWTTKSLLGLSHLLDHQ